MQSAVHLREVSKTYGEHRAVDALDLDVPDGAIYGFIGPNGSGKTTTIRMILHIIYPDAGEVEVLGQRGIRAANDHIGYLPEERGLYKKMPVGKLLSYYAVLKGMPKRETGNAVTTWLDRLELADWKNTKIEALSKGMAQKVQFISAVIANPKLLILDEPFSGLDPVNSEVLRAQILRLREAGTTIIFSTHDMSAAEKMCDGIFMIHRGKKVLDGSLASIQERYGADTIRLRAGDGVAAKVLASMPGIEDVRDHGQFQEVRLEGDPQGLLKRLCEAGEVSLFEVVRPSLHDIFVRIAGEGRSS
ncbi:MAG: ABC transporter ATP-binding protein [Verrucomicrobiales bacterium]